MLEKLSVKTFKSLEDVTVELGLVNVFVGANGSGKSNLLEALGVLSAAAYGRVDDETLLSRGVRPGVPALYKSAFPARPGTRIPPHLSFGASNTDASYDVTLHNPLRDPLPEWRFKSESWSGPTGRLVGRSPASGQNLNPQRGMAALKAVDVSGGATLELLESLQGYVIFSPTLAVLRGASDPHPKQPLGLFGGNLDRSLMGLIMRCKHDEHSEIIYNDLLEIVEWAEKIDVVQALPSSVLASNLVIRFHDRFMRKRANFVTANDAPEGALYALFHAVLASQYQSPMLCAVDNADHGLNPRMARSLIERLCRWYLEANEPRQYY